MAKKITEEELVARVDRELVDARDLANELSSQRSKAMDYYLGKPIGDLAPPEVDGRSSYVSTDVSDTIEWMLPSLLRIFVASDRIVQLKPKKPGMEDLVGDVTDYLNWIFYDQNNGFLCLYTAIKDALLSKTGIIKVWWEDGKDEAREEYFGLSDLEFAQLLDDPEIEPIEHTSTPDEDAVKRREQDLAKLVSALHAAQIAPNQGIPQQGVPGAPLQGAALPGGILGPQNPGQQQLVMAIQALQHAPVPMLHDVAVKRTRKKTGVRIAPVPPEEFFISRHAENVADSPFVAHVREWTLSDLRAEGYDIADGETLSGENEISNDDLALSRDGGTSLLFDDVEGDDDSMRRVWVSESYFRADVDGDGIAEWRRLLKCGAKVLESEECDGPPFVTLTPVPLTHQFFGLSIADLAMESQRHKSQIIRAMLDNVYLQVNGRNYAVEGSVNLDDLLTSRPGGVVRVKSPQAVGPLNQGMGDMADSQNLLSFLEVQKESRTGWTRQSAGPAENVLNKTATEFSIVTNRDDMRVELIARIFAETGIRDLFKKILEMVCKYQQQPAEVMLNGRWLTLNPREWRHMFSLSIDVGLGSNDPNTKIGMLERLMAVQEKLASAGTDIVDQQGLYHSAREMVKALGYRDPDLFIRDPGPPKPKPPQPSPQDIAMQVERERANLQKELEIVKANRDMQIDANRQKVQADQVAQQKLLEAQMASLKAKYQSDFERENRESEERIAAVREKTNLIIAREKNATALQVEAMRIASKAEPVLPVPPGPPVGPMPPCPPVDFPEELSLLGGPIEGGNE